MKAKYFLFVGTLLHIGFSNCVAILCYQCSDSGDSETSACVRGVHGLSVQRADYEKQLKIVSSRNFYRDFPALKNCSHYRDKTTGRELFEFCKIERIFSGGNLNAYIRDCSNGQDFAMDLNITRLSQRYIKPDNQSSCGYSHQHIANLCVQICTGDFCNGPLAGQTIVYAHPVIVFILALFATVVSRAKFI